MALVLDDFLYQVKLALHSPTVTQPGFGLQEVESQPFAKNAIATLVNDIVTKQGSQIFAKRTWLLDGLGDETYGEPFSNEVYSGCAIRAEKIPGVLQRVLELSLRSIVYLPSKDANPDHNPKYNPKRALALAAALVKYGTMLNSTLRGQELVARARCVLGEDHVDFCRLMHAGEEGQWAGRTLKTIAKRKLKRILPDSPNPQVRFALYLAGWIENSTGKPHFALLKTLIAAAFHSAGKAVPKWVERIEIEMHGKKKRRQAWADSITVKAPSPVIPPSSL